MLVVPTFTLSEAAAAQLLGTTTADHAGRTDTTWHPDGGDGGFAVPSGVPRTKEQLREVLVQLPDSVQGFHCGKFKQRTQSFDYDAWWAAPPGSRPYDLTYHEYWEPVGVVAAAGLPAYDPAFQGYGLNKVQFSYHLAALGYAFRALPDHFFITLPHPRSPSYRAAFGTSADPSHVARVVALYEGFKERIAWQCGGYRAPL